MRNEKKDFKLSEIPEDQLKDPKDCHKIPFLDSWIGKRATIVTSKGTVKGRLEYLDGWYFCQAPFRLVEGDWVRSPYRFTFRKGHFRRIKLERVENSVGL